MGRRALDRVHGPRLVAGPQPVCSSRPGPGRTSRVPLGDPGGAPLSRRPERRTPTHPIVWARGAFLAALLLVGVGCESSHTTLEDWLAKVEWFPTMRRQPSIEAYEEPRLPADGTLPIDGDFPLSLLEAERIAASPLPATPASLERGQTQYDVFCTVCHGPEGSGGGNVAVAQTGFPPGLIPSLTADRARALTDGYLYGMILNGRGLMPNYRRIPEEDRWHIVNYVRALQRRAAAAPAEGP